ncbi:hypothetical protein E4U30_002235 [Claviceps sp. LM220 group G6]|nr:hypothetical protein E4U30_002235 [Claviceps sp. LM220 group G6]KAG6098330.1 hypothetical protein E4U31_004743 [Claviceps sp. LM219 group G6]
MSDVACDEALTLCTANHMPVDRVALDVPLFLPSVSLLSVRAIKLIPLLIAIVFVSAIGWVLYQVYDSATKIRDTASERMGKKNVLFTKDGVRVGVKDVQNEKYVDKTQSWVVKAWNLGQLKPDADM